MKHLPQNDAAFCVKSEQLSFAAKCNRIGGRRRHESFCSSNEQKQRTYVDTAELGGSGAAIGTGVASLLFRKGGSESQPFSQK
jgi:hypothetical protein